MIHQNYYFINEDIEDSDETLIDFVNQLIENAISKSASDIHIEPYSTTARIRYRCDGMLREISLLTNQYASRVITRLKIIAKLDITEHRLPQDGRFRYLSTDIRINICPAYFGEKAVLRLLNNDKTTLKIESLGLSDDQKTIFIENITKPQGMIIITGPTSSGKTATLYAALNHLNSHEKNITTLEDPVEIQMQGINQMNINSKIHLDFSTLLRAILRQDPDIIMIGEIRDKDTASIAVQAATTGHLVLTSLHTNSAADAIARLISLDISPLHIANAISLIVAQRLVRKLCSYCKCYNMEKNIYHAMGCHQCVNGYWGRTAIFELLPIEENMSTHMFVDYNPITIKNIMENNGYTLLRQAAHQQVLSGITSIDEINRMIMNYQ